MEPPADQIPPNEPLVADTDEVEESDSVLDQSITSSTASITSSIMQYRLENGRSYHAYKEGKYILPNDEAENNRLDLQHHLFSLTFDGKLYTCPAGKEKQLHRVLDAGTGTGIWALDFADEHPESQVIGIDLSPIQPAFVPPNLTFYVDDLEEKWTYASKFDFIYARMLTGSLSNWPSFFEQSFEHLNPGGWIELADIVFPIESDDGTVPPDSAIKRWGDLSLEASKVLKRPLDSAKLYKEQLASAGFTNIVETKYKWPQTSWPKERKYKEMGMWSYHDICGEISGLSLALFTRGLKWKAEELEVFLVDVRKDFANKQLHGYWPIYVVYAQKPE